MHQFHPLRAVALFALLATLGACGKDKAAAVQAGSDPVAAVTALAKSLRDNDLQGFYAQSVPADLRARTEAAYDTKRASLPSADAEEREEFAQNMAKLTANDAEQVLYADLEPSLIKLEAEVASQLPMMVAMGSGFASAAISESETLSDDEKQHASSVLAAITGWASTAPIADREKARAAITAVTHTARALQISDLDTLRTLSMDDALGKGGLAWAGVKQITALYGLDLDPVLDSVKAEVADREGDSARVRVSYALLGKPVNFEMAMTERDGHWFSSDAIARAEAALARLDQADAEHEVMADSESAVAADADEALPEAADDASSH